MEIESKTDLYMHVYMNSHSQPSLLTKVENEGQDLILSIRNWPDFKNCESHLKNEPELIAGLYYTITYVIEILNRKTENVNVIFTLFFLTVISLLRLTSQQSPNLMSFTHAKAESYFRPTPLHTPNTLLSTHCTHPSR